MTSAQLASAMNNLDPQTLLLLSQQLADLANSQLSGGGGGGGGAGAMTAPSMGGMQDFAAVAGGGMQEMTPATTNLPPGPYTGAFDREVGKFGFIKQDSGEDDMFVLPGSCKAFNEIWPPKGTRVTYDCVRDPKSGRLKAENVQPEGGFVAQANGPIPTTHSGTFERDRGNFGFIKQDNGEDDIFCLPGACVAYGRPGACKNFGEKFPAIGTRVVYNLELDAKSQRWRAIDVQLEGGSVLGGMSSDAMALVQGALAGVAANTGGGSFQQQQQQFGQAMKSPQVPGQIYTGKFDRERGSFGFIRQDNGCDDMFVLPSNCEAFGGYFPPLGTRVMYSVYFDTLNGKPRAENVQPEQSGVLIGQQQQQLALPAPMTNGGGFDVPPAVAAPQQQSVYPPGQCYSGHFDRERGTYGFIKQDSGFDDMFVLPGACEAFGGVFPAIGTRVSYTVKNDPKSGKPIAEQVWPESGSSGGGVVDNNSFQAFPTFGQQDETTRFSPYG